MLIECQVRDCRKKTTKISTSTSSFGSIFWANYLKFCSTLGTNCFEIWSFFFYSALHLFCQIRQIQTVRIITRFSMNQFLYVLPRRLLSSFIQVYWREMFEALESEAWNIEKYQNHLQIEWLNVRKWVFPNYSKLQLEPYRHGHFHSTGACRFLMKMESISCDSFSSKSLPNHYR